MKKINSIEAEIVDPSIIITRRERLLKQIFDKYFFYFESISAINGRCINKKEDVSEFFKRFCEKSIVELEKTLYKEDIEPIRKSYIFHLIGRIRKEGKDIREVIINEIARDNQSIENVYNFISKEEIQLFEKMIIDHFGMPQKYVSIFRSMIGENDIEDIIEGDQSAPVETEKIKKEIASFLISKIIENKL